MHSIRNLSQNDSRRRYLVFFEYCSNSNDLASCFGIIFYSESQASRRWLEERQRTYVHSRESSMIINCAIDASHFHREQESIRYLKADSIEILRARRVRFPDLEWLVCWSLEGNEDSEWTYPNQDHPFYKNLEPAMLEVRWSFRLF